VTVYPHRCELDNTLIMHVWRVAEPDEGTSRVLYISDEAVSGLVWTNNCWCIRLCHVHQRPIHQLTIRIWRDAFQHAITFTACYSSLIHLFDCSDFMAFSFNSVFVL